MINIISFALDYIFYMFIRRECLFLPLFTVSSLIFIKRDDNYYIKTIIIGFIYGVFLSNNYLLHILLFILLGIIINIFYRKFKYNYLNNILLGVIIISVYQLIILLLNNLENIIIMKNYYLINLIYIFVVTCFRRIKE